MKRKHQRLIIIALGGLALAGAAALILTAFEGNIVFFHSPTELTEKQYRPDQRLRIGGLVVEGSVVKETDGLTTRFEVTDLNKSIAVSYRGILPDLFREGQGVVAEGHLRGGVFIAAEVLAKHDETYMPREVAEAIKKSGQWKGKNPPAGKPK